MHYNWISTSALDPDSFVQRKHTSLFPGPFPSISEAHLPRYFICPDLGLPLVLAKFALYSSSSLYNRQCQWEVISYRFSCQFTVPWATATTIILASPWGKTLPLPFLRPNLRTSSEPGAGSLSNFPQHS